MNTTIPAVGEKATVTVLSGYKLEQDRPFCCRTWRPSKKNPGAYTGACEGECGGNCNGTYTTYAGVVEGVIRWMDNSVDVEVRCEDGVLRRKELVAPHGDRCF